VSATHTPCTGPGLACANPDHDHRTEQDAEEDNQTPQGQKLCNDCGAPTHWDEATLDYYHDSEDTPPCFLIR
jgi:hypothetical protein